MTNDLPAGTVIATLRNDVTRREALAVLRDGTMTQMSFERALHALKCGHESISTDMSFEVLGIDGSFIHHFIKRGTES